MRFIEDTSSSTTTTTSTTDLTDTNGNAISSGTATISFSGTSKTLSAAYLIDGVDVVITSGVPMIYLTNITAEITLSGNKMVQQSSSDYFIMCEATNQWGTTGQNGATVTLDVTSQDLSDLTSTNAYVGSTSSLTGATGFTVTN